MASGVLLFRRMLGPLAGQLERYMDLLSARQKLVASNIANAGYSRISHAGHRFPGGIPERRWAAAARGGGAGAGGEERRQQCQPRPRIAAAGGKRAAVSTGLQSDAGADPRWCGRPSRKVRTHESVFGSFRRRVRNGGAAHARRAAGGESGQRRDHAHARRRPVPAQRRGLREHRRRVAFLVDLRRAAARARRRGGVAMSWSIRAIPRRAICRAIPMPMPTATWHFRESIRPKTWWT